MVDVSLQSSYEKKVHGTSADLANYYNSSKCCTLNSTYYKKVEIFLHYRWLFIKGDIFIGEWEIFGAEFFLCYSQFLC